MTEPINIEQINIELAGNCNLKCKMCTQAYGREEEFLSKLPIGLFYKAVDETIPLGLKYVSIGGSGEPLLYRDLEVVVKYLSDRNIESLMYTNLITLKEDRFKRLCDAGLGALKISAQGWDRDSYKEWMSIDAFDRIRENVLNFKNIAQDNKYPILIQTNHLIHDVSNIEYQRDQYVDNWVNYLDVQAEIWLDHNWSGGFNQDSSSRFAMFHDRKRRSCGRPLSSVVEIRAGGLNGKHGSIVPCPNVLGMDSAAVIDSLGGLFNVRVGLDTSGTRITYYDQTDV